MYVCVYLCIAMYVYTFAFTVSVSQQTLILDQQLSAATSSLLYLEEHQPNTTSSSQQQPQISALEQNQWTFGTQQEPKSSNLCNVYN